MGVLNIADHFDGDDSDRISVIFGEERLGKNLSREELNYVLSFVEYCGPDLEQEAERLCYLVR